MTKRGGYQTPQIENKVFTSAEEVKRGIAKLQRRISEVTSLNPQQIPHDDATVETARHNIRDTVREVFGAQSQEARDFFNPEIYVSDGYINDWDEEPDHYTSFSKGIQHMEKLLKGLIAKLEEKLVDFEEDPISQARVVFEGMNLHPRIAGACSDLYKNGHYSQSVFEASKALVNFVKERSGRHDLDGVPLMTNVFSKIILFWLLMI
jgi:ribosome-associated translation inhibitor RaiA